MLIEISVKSGPHSGKSFTFDRHDTFLVGRSTDAHLQLSYDDPYFSRRHFLIEVNPPRCRVIDLKSRNGISVNGQRVTTAELNDGDELHAGHTVFRFSIPKPDPNAQETLLVSSGQVPDSDVTIDHTQERIPGYVLGPEVGRGAMGIVYRAIRSSDGHPVAIKAITPTDGTKNKKSQRFLREAQLMSTLKHDNIIAFFESGSAEPLIYLVMEFVEGMDASKHMVTHGPLSVPIAVRVTCQILAGLGHAHTNGIVHRDVKPSNILFGGLKGKRVAKVADFGLARMFEECRLSGLTFQGEIGGTPAYMAPEQVTHFRDVKPSADQYSAAASLYNLLTNAYPHDLPKDIGAQLAVIITEPVVPLNQRRPDLPPGLVEVIHTALARDPAHRFRSVDEFRKALLPFAK